MLTTVFRNFWLRHETLQMPLHKHPIGECHLIKKKNNHGTISTHFRIEQTAWAGLGRPKPGEVSGPPRPRTWTAWTGSIGLTVRTGVGETVRTGGD